MSLPFLRSVGTLPLVLGLAAVIAACSPTANALPTALPAAGESAQPSAIGSGGADPSGAPPSGASSDPLVAWPAFAACLRAHGANVADPVLDANGDPQWGDDLKQLLTEPLRAACSPIIEAVSEGGKLDGRIRPTYSIESELAHAACMRSHGLPTWPDPTSTSHAGTMPEGFDKADPTVLAGLIACEPLLVEMAASPSPGQ